MSFDLGLDARDETGGRGRSGEQETSQWTLVWIRRTVLRDRQLKADLQLKPGLRVARSYVLPPNAVERSKRLA